MAEYNTGLMPLVAAQPGIWMADKLTRQYNAWSVAHYVELNGEIDPLLLANAIVAGMNEADTLKMRFSEVDGEARQWVDESVQFPLPPVIDLRGNSQPEQDARAYMQVDLDQDLRLESGQPLYHHALLRTGEQRWLWYQRYHHLLVDGFSFPAITRRIAALYSAARKAKTPAPSPFTPFSDVVDEYLRYQDSDAFYRDAAFWREHLAHLPAAATLSGEPLSADPSTAELHRFKLKFDNADIAALLAHSNGQTLADMAIALTATWLGRLCGRNDFSAGFIFMRRLGSSALCASGPVLNVLPLAVQVKPEATLVELAASLSTQLKKMRRHQRFDAEQILRDAGRVVSDEPLYGPVINLKMFDYHLELDGVPGVTHTLATGPVKDLEIALLPDEQGGLALELLANAGRYHARELERHLARLPLLLRQFAAAPELPCAGGELLHGEEAALIERVNDTTTLLPVETLSSLIVKQAAATPDAPALADAQYQFTYREMREQVQALAAELTHRGVRPGDIVAVALPRSVFLSLALQAIVEVGAAWLPLDTGYPDERLNMMLEDAAPRLLITEPQQAARFSGQQIFSYTAPLTTPDAPMECVSRPEHTAYVIFTSGSTGRPKGVMVGQTAIVNRLLWMQAHYQLRHDDVVLQKTPSSFDVSVWEFFWPFIAGAQLVMAPPETHRDPQALLQLFACYQVTTTHFVPSMLAAFTAALNGPEAVTDCASLRRVFCSGEALPAALCREWEQLTAVPLHNLYGPTEAAVDVSWYPAYGEQLAAVTGSSVPIGFPVWNTGLRILDGAMRPVPPGIAGDLYLTGVQLAQGYLGRPDLTASRFIADPFAPGERMYRTGDVARWLENGAVEYLGRSDDQLKIRGQRIELGEIEQAMLSLPGVAQAVTHACVLNSAAATGGDARQLVGYLVPAHGETPDPAALRARLAARLPAHMVPVALVVLEAFPLSANGKLDRKALPLPQVVDGPGSRAPLPGLESDIAAAFAELLDCDITDASADFFALGGHSLLAMRLAAGLKRTLRRPVSVGQIMVASTVEKLAVLLEQTRSEQQASDSGFDAVLPLRQSTGPTLFCFHPASGFAWQFSVLQRYLDARWSITGLQSPRPHGPMMACETLDEVCDVHLARLRKLQPQGPYHLFGYSLGGTLAQGIAARLQAAGEEVAFLGLLDTWPPESQNWAGKNPTDRDPEVLAEINREREAFINAQQEQGSERLFETIEGNYGDAVRLLSSAHSVPFAGKATLFVANRTLKPGMDPHRTWAPWIANLEVYPQDCAHVEIISPQAFESIGPVLGGILKKCAG